MSNETMNAAITDPLHSVADALDAAAHAARGGMEDVRAKVSDSLPAIASSLSDATYKSCYAISYGLCFPAALIARAIPKENAAVHGLIDGAHAAIDLVNEIRAKKSVSG